MPKMRKTLHPDCEHLGAQSLGFREARSESVRR
jgi:hypothetical protein